MMLQYMLYSSCTSTLLIHSRVFYLLQKAQAWLLAPLAIEARAGSAEARGAGSSGRGRARSTHGARRTRTARWSSAILTRLQRR
eukprot:2294675-Pleurochrysis_carterae.AAC.3